MKKIFGTLFILSVLFTGTFAFANAPGDDCLFDTGTSDVPGKHGSTAPFACVATGGGGGGSLSGGGGGNTLTVNEKIKNPIKVNTFSAFVELVISSAVTILMPFVVLAFVYSGFLFVLAQGNQEKLKEAKEAIKWSIVGAFILLGAHGFAKIIGSTVSTITTG